MTERDDKTMPITDADIERAIQVNLAKLKLLPDVTADTRGDFDSGDTETDTSAAK